MILYVCTQYNLDVIIYKMFCFFSTINAFLFSSDILQREGMNADALYVRGMCLYYQDSTEKAFQHFQEVLKRAPDHHKAKDIYRVRTV